MRRRSLLLIAGAIAATVLPATTAEARCYSEPQEICTVICRVIKPRCETW